MLSELSCEQPSCVLLQHGHSKRGQALTQHRMHRSVASLSWGRGAASSTPQSLFLDVEPWKRPPCLLPPATAPLRGSWAPQGESLSPSEGVPGTSPALSPFLVLPALRGLGEEVFAFSPEPGNLGGFLSQPLEPLIFSE